MAVRRNPIRSLAKSESATAWLLLLPFLCVYAIFLISPFIKGLWISLHEWNLLAVAFNPDAKSFVGTENYVRVMWGKNIQWFFNARPLVQGLTAIVFVVCAVRLSMTRPTRAMMLSACVALAIFFIAGFAPGEGGRWFDRRFWPTVGNTIVFVSWTVPLVTILSAILAAALNRETRLMSFYRTLFFLSNVLSVTVVTLIWQIMFSPRQGLLANVSHVLGGSPISWLTDENFAMAAIVVTTIWWSTGLAMILFIAGIRNINPEIYEAATLDNATGAKAFWYITLPNLKRTITLVVVLQIILHFQVFGQSHLMTSGGPNDTTQVLVRYIYQTAFRDSDLGRASAMAMFLFLIMAIFSAVQFLIMREEQS